MAAAPRPPAPAIDPDTISDDGKVTLSNDEISDGDSTDSGLSTDNAVKTTRMVQTAKDRQATQAIALSRVTAMCTMCDVQRSEYMCASCGRLSFCLKCAVSLHDNKFLGGHKLEGAYDSSAIYAVAQLKAMANPIPVAQKVAPPPINHDPVAADGSWKKNIPAEAGQDAAAAARQSQIDAAELAADQRLLTARLRELKGTQETLRTMVQSATEEKGHCADAVTTAKEAVRRKFDILRNLLNAKEHEFLGVVDGAGKQRLDAATKLVCDATVALSETQGFVGHLETQLERLQPHKALFAESRRGLLDSSAGKLTVLDDAITKFHLDLDECRHVSLGVAVPIEGVVIAIQSIVVPATALPIGSAVDPPNPVQSTEEFFSAPGVKQWVSDGSQLGDGPTPRRSFAKELESLRATPLSTVASQINGRGTPTTTAQPASRGASPARAPSPNRGGTAQPPVALAPPPPQPYQDPAASSSLIAKTASRTGSLRGAFPPELEALKRQIAARHSGPVTPRRATGDDASVRPARLPASQVERQASLLSTTSTRRSSPTPRAATPTRSSGPDAFPGPGAYYQPQSFNARSVLSTPPKSMSRR